MNTAIKNLQILDNAYGVLGIELMAAAQALDFRTLGRAVESPPRIASYARMWSIWTRTDHCTAITTE